MVSNCTSECKPWISFHQVALFKELEDASARLLWHLGANQKMKDTLPAFCGIGIKKGNVNMVLIPRLARHTKRTGISSAHEQTTRIRKLPSCQRRFKLLAKSAVKDQRTLMFLNNMQFSQSNKRFILLPSIRRLISTTPLFRTNIRIKPRIEIDNGNRLNTIQHRKHHMFRQTRKQSNQPKIPKYRKT